MTRRRLYFFSFFLAEPKIPSIPPNRPTLTANEMEPYPMDPGKVRKSGEHGDIFQEVGLRWKLADHIFSFHVLSFTPPE